MQTLKCCSAANSQQKEKCLIKLTSALFPNDVNNNTNNVKIKSEYIKSEYIKTESTAFDEDENKNENNNSNNNNNNCNTNTNNKRTEISEYLHSCRNNTIYNESLLSQLYRENHLKLEDIKIDNTAASDATFWICDMIKSDCLLMYISSKETFLCNEYLDIYFINLNNENNFAKICVDSSNTTDYTILSGSFMDKSAEKKEYLIEDVLCYKSELINKTLYERMGLIGKTVGNFRQIRGKNNGLYPFDFRGKPWIPNNSPKGCVDFFKWYRQSSSTGNIMFHDGRHSENFSKGYMIWSNNHIPFRSKHTMFNYVYAPKFFVQIGLPIQARHNTTQFHSDGHQQIGMTNKNGIVQDFNAMSNQSIQMWLRNDSDGLRSVCAIKAQFDAESMKKLIQISSTNTHNQWLLCSIIYNKAKSCYTLINILTESKITNIVEKNSEKYNKLLIKCGSTSTVHSASDKEKSTLLTSSVTEFVTNCTKMIQSVTKNDIIKAFQSLSKPVLVKQEKLKKQQLQLKQQQQHRHHNGHNNNRQHHNRPYKQYIPDPPNYNSHNNNRQHNNTQY